MNIYSDVITSPRGLAAFVQEKGAREKVSRQLIDQMNHLAPHNQSHFERVLSIYQSCAQDLTENYRKKCCSFFVKSLIALPKERLKRLRQSGMDLPDMIAKSNCTPLEKRAAYKAILLK